MLRYFYRIVFFTLLLLTTAHSQIAMAEKIVQMKVRGNAKVEADAILTILETKQGNQLNKNLIKEDISSLYSLGYFSSIRFLKNQIAGGIEVIVEVIEKPAIINIGFEGMEEVSVDDIKDKMQTKVYTIINEAVINADVRMIEQQYAEKGFFLAKVSYELRETNKNEVDLIFKVEEHGKVLVGEVEILGNEFFNDAELIDLFATRPHTRSAAISDASLYHGDKVKRDVEFLAFYYRDFGFAEVKIAKPISFMDTDRKFVRVTFQVEEGIQYNVGKIDVSGDLLFPKEELFEAMTLKASSDVLFKHSWFVKDVQMLQDRYGDLGYAYADINPKTTFNRETKTVDINYVVTKGEKVYFGDITVVGNTKTRDNVIRREMEVNDAELYSGTGKTRSKRNLDRLGFFEETQILQERDAQAENVLNLKVRVKEGNTGQLQAAVGYTPAQEQDARWFGQGKYEEKNQSGRGWNTQFSAQWSDKKNYSISANFLNPRVNNSWWSLGLNAGFAKNSRSLLVYDFEQTRQSFGVSIGRRIIELIRGQVSYVRSNTLQTFIGGTPALLSLVDVSGIRSSLIFQVSRADLDNNIDPTEGSSVILRHKLTGVGFLGGDYTYQEASLITEHYLPIDFTDTYRTYFKLHGSLEALFPVGDEPVPFPDRYMLGGFNDLRGYSYREVGPRFRVLTAPGAEPLDYPRGGDKKLLFQLEYFIPLIPEAKIKGLLFTDYGRVFDDDEAIEFSGFSRDVGFGIRWITPIAPFRFEWAYPVLEDGSFGDLKVIFNIGY